MAALVLSTAPFDRVVGGAGLDLGDGALSGDPDRELDPREPVGAAAVVVGVARQYHALIGRVGRDAVGAGGRNHPIDLRVGRGVGWHRAEEGLCEPRRQVRRGFGQPDRQRVCSRGDSRDVSGFAGHVGAGADDVGGPAGGGALHCRVEGALDRVLERLGGDPLGRRRREPKAAADRERVGLAVGRARRQRLRDLGHELGPRQPGLVGVVEELRAGRVQHLPQQRLVGQRRIHGCRNRTASRLVPRRLRRAW